MNQQGVSANPSANQERTFGMLCHLLALSIFIGIPFGNILGPLIMWLIKKDEFPLVNQEGKKALNFQISMTIYAIIGGVLCFILIGFLVLIAIAIAEIILVILASVKTHNGEDFKYPLTIQFLK